MLHDRMLLLSISHKMISLHFCCVCLLINVIDQYLKDAIHEIIKFFESNHSVSQTIALETAAAVQVFFYLYMISVL